MWRDHTLDWWLTLGNQAWCGSERRILASARMQNGDEWCRKENTLSAYRASSGSIMLFKFFQSGWTKSSNIPSGSFYWPEGSRDSWSRMLSWGRKDIKKLNLALALYPVSVIFDVALHNKKTALNRGGPWTAAATATATTTRTRRRRRRTTTTTATTKASILDLHE